jgi:SAM-dependent methyltransferase
MPSYSETFYEQHTMGSSLSASVMVPLLLELIQPLSVVDVGCGTGGWLKVFHQHGVKDVLGIDGDYVDKEALLIPTRQFLSFDLAKQLQLDRRFDLVLSLEVAEHIPVECAVVFVESLINLGPIILFSAAIPSQGGTHHINEQWPDYWARLFNERGFACLDCLRHRVWNDARVEWWYAQNILLFVSKVELAANPALQREADKTREQQLSLVHPRSWSAKIAELTLLRQLPKLLSHLEGSIPAGSKYVLIDDDMLSRDLLAGREALTFLEKDGRSWGSPADDASAVNELESLRRRGASFIVFVSVAFWWLEYYREFAAHLRRSFPILLENDYAVIFDLR